MGNFEQRLGVLAVTQATSKAKTKNGAKRKSQANKAQASKSEGSSGQA